MKLSINLLLSDVEKDFIGKSGFFNGSTVSEEEGKKTKMEKSKKRKSRDRQRNDGSLHLVLFKESAVCF